MAAANNAVTVAVENVGFAPTASSTAVTVAVENVGFAPTASSTALTVAGENVGFALTASGTAVTVAVENVVDTVLGVTAAVTSTAVVGAVTGGGGATITGVTAAVISTAVVGTPTGGSGVSATVTGVKAAVTSTAVPGTPTGVSGTAVTGVTAAVISTAVVGAPTGVVTVAGVTASSTATAPAGIATGLSQITIAGTGVRSRTAAAVMAVNAPPSGVVDLVFTVNARLPASGAGAVTVAHASAPNGRWQLEDPVRGDVYVFPINPKTASSPEPIRKITETATTTGKPISHEGSAEPVTWTLVGQLVTAAELATLTDFYHRPNKIFLTDDLARTWVAYLEAFQPIPRIGPEVHVANYTLRVVLFQELT